MMPSTTVTAVAPANENKIFGNNGQLRDEKKALLPKYYNDELEEEDSDSDSDFEENTYDQKKNISSAGWGDVIALLCIVAAFWAIPFFAWFFGSFKVSKTEPITTDSHPVSAVGRPLDATSESSLDTTVGSLASNAAAALEELESIESGSSTSSGDTNSQ